MKKEEPKQENMAAQILNAQEAVNKLMSIQKYLIWMRDGEYSGGAVQVTQEAYSQFLDSEGQILITNYCATLALTLALERANKWEQIADYCKKAVREREVELQVWS